MSMLRGTAPKWNFFHLGRMFRWEKIAKVVSVELYQKLRK